MISRLQLEENWDAIRNAVRSHWPILGGEELEDARHSAGHFIGLIQQRTGQPREDIERFVESAVRPVPSFLRQTSAKSPLGAISIAFGAGLVLGLVTTALMAPSDT